MARRYWLMKSEPEVFSIEALAKAPGKSTFWDGIRNYQARNFLRETQVGDGILFYHSSADPPGVAGTAKVSAAPAPDPSQWDPKSDYHDPASKREEPRWYGVQITLDRIFPRLLSLDELRTHAPLADMALFKRSRLSVQPVSEAEWKYILDLARA